MALPLPLEDKEREQRTRESHDQRPTYPEPHKLITLSKATAATEFSHSGHLHEVTILFF